MIFYAISNVAYPVSLHGPGAELEGVFKHTHPDPALLVPSTGTVRDNGEVAKLT